ncbi:MAG: efflux RND transporter periplasmic adaptor subunit [Pseudomonadota bacterium]|nr:MAG: efflux RND transporter periplasmic adaptor subunit [Pseudomonadota bacterium]
MGAQPEPQDESEPDIAWISRDRAPLEPLTPSQGGQTGSAERFGSTRTRWIAGIVALVVAVAAVVWATRGSAPAPATAVGSQTSVPLVTVVTPGRNAVQSTVTFTGTIHARNDMPIGVEGEGGRIVAVYVEAGDRVRAGQLLAKLDDSVLRPQVNRLVAALDEARAQANLSQAEYRRAQGVEAAGALSAEEIERRRAAAITDEARVKVAAAQLAEAQARLDRTEIRAPAAGVILTRRAEVGQTATPGGEPLFRLAKDGEVEMRAQVAEQDLPRLAIGQRALVRLTGIAEPFEGKIWLLGAVIDPQTRLGEVRIALPSHPLLRPGAFARAEVMVESAERIVLPTTAVLSDNRGTYVMIVNDENRVERRAVQVADTLPQGVVIADGLTGEERVIAVAGAFLREGEEVRIAQDTEQAS